MIEMQIARRLHASLSRRALTEVCNHVHGPNIRWRSKSFAASVSSDKPEVKKDRKRVSKDERKAMVESFVNKHRVMNSGKFPTASAAMKQVGGSYYVVKKILQELEYESTRCSMKTLKETSLESKVAEERCSSAAVEEALNCQVSVDSEIDEYTMSSLNTMNNTSFDNGKAEKTETSTAVACEQFVEKEESQASVLDEKKPSEKSDKSKYVVTQNHLLHEEAKEVLHHCVGKPKDVKETAAPEKMLNVDVPKPETGQHQQLNVNAPKPDTEQHQNSSELEKTAREIAEKQDDYEGIQKKSSLWENLKSLADGFINIWRKL